jgi:hypothetical protein
MLLTAAQELDRLAREFRRTLRDSAVKLSQGAADLEPIGPHSILAALPLACQQLLRAAESTSRDGGDSSGRKRDAA